MSDDNVILLSTYQTDDPTEVLKTRSYSGVVSNSPIVSTKSADNATMDTDDQSKGDAMSDSYSKDVIDEKLKNLELTIENKFDRMIHHVDKGFDSIRAEMTTMTVDYKTNFSWIQGISIGLIVSVIILIAQNTAIIMKNNTTKANPNLSQTQEKEVRTPKRE